MPRWEYTTLYSLITGHRSDGSAIYSYIWEGTRLNVPSSTRALNHIGSQSWELVAAIAVSPTEIAYHFKRPLA